MTGDQHLMQLPMGLSIQGGSVQATVGATATQLRTEMLAQAQTLGAEELLIGSRLLPLSPLVQLTDTKSNLAQWMRGVCSHILLGGGLSVWSDDFESIDRSGGDSHLSYIVKYDSGKWR